MEAKVGGCGGGLPSQRGLLRPEKPDEGEKEAKEVLRRHLAVPVSFSEEGQRARLNALNVFLVYQRGAARGETNVIFQHAAVSAIGISLQHGARCGRCSQRGLRIE